MSYDGHTGIDDNECSFPIMNGEQLVVFSSAEDEPDGVSYIRFVENQAPYTELLYYCCDEWKESPREVMGAIMGACMNGAERL